MATISIIDDRQAMRRTIARSIREELPDGWDVIDSPPLESVEEYLEYVIGHGISVLVVDEHLDEQGGGVSYSGHEIAGFLRRYRPEFPIVMITADPGDGDLQAHEGDLDIVADRDSFFANPERWVPRFVRAGQRYLETHGLQLRQLSELAEKSAAGEITDKERQQLKSLQAMMSVGFIPRNTDLADSALSDVMEILEGADDLRARVGRLLAQGKDTGDVSVRKVARAKKISGEMSQAPRTKNSGKSAKGKRK